MSLFFIDGSTPSDTILQRFLEIAENAEGALAVHCKAGLGRTGTLIGAYIMKHYKFTAAEAIGWIRVSRPGSIIGPQQNYMEEKQAWLWMQGDIFRAKQKERERLRDKPSGYSHILSAVDDMRIEDAFDNNNSVASKYDNIVLEHTEYMVPKSEEMTQGDRLNQLKLQRKHPRAATTGTVRMDDAKTHKRSTTQPFRVAGTKSAQSVSSPLKSSKIASHSANPITSGTSATSRRIHRHHSTGTTSSIHKGRTSYPRTIRSTSNING